MKRQFLWALLLLIAAASTAHGQLGNPYVNASGGTTVNLLATINSSNQVVAATTSSTTVPAWIVVGGAGTSGVAQLAGFGQASCTMDATNASGAGNYFVIASTTTAGDCHAQSAAPAAGTWVVGYLAASATTSGSTALVNVNGFFYPSTSSGGGDTITSPNGTLTPGGTSTATTLDFNLAHANTFTAAQAATTFNATSLPAAYQINSVNFMIQPNSDTTSIAIGPSASAAQTGTNDTVLGNLAFEYATSAGYSVAIGSQAMQGVSGTPLTGGNNTAVGNKALEVLQGAAGDNTAVGNQAMAATTAAVQNTAVGSFSLSSNVTGTYNTALGFGSAQNVTANYDTALGYQAFKYGSNGGYNTAVGTQALTGASGTPTTGIGNVAVGYLALGSVQGAGASNTAVGYEAGYAGTALATGANNTFLGYECGALAATDTNEICIGGNALTGLGSNTVNIGGVFKVTGTGTPSTSIATLPGLTTAGLVTTTSGGVLGSEATATIAQGGTGQTTAAAALTALGGAPALSIPTGTPTYAAGTNVTSVACATSYTCTNTRGELTIVGGTATTGTIATVSFSATLGAAPGLCLVTQNAQNSLMSTNFGIGHGLPSTSSFTITSGSSVTNATITVDYYCML